MIVTNIIATIMMIMIMITNMIRLMAEILHHLGCMNPYGIFTISTGAGFLPSTVVTIMVMMIIMTMIMITKIVTDEENNKNNNNTLQGTNISPQNGILKMIFLFLRWDMLIPWRVMTSLIIPSRSSHCPSLDLILDVMGWPPRIPAPHRNTAEAFLPKHPMFAHIDLSHMQLGGAFEDVLFCTPIPWQMIEKFEDFSKMGWNKTTNEASFWP